MIAKAAVLKLLAILGVLLLSNDKLKQVNSEMEASRSIRKLTGFLGILIALLLLAKPSLGSIPARIDVESMTVGSIYYARGSDFAVPYENTEWPAYLKLVEIRGAGGGCCYCGVPTGLYYIESQWAAGPQFWIRTEYSIPLPAHWPPNRCWCGICFQTKFVLHILEPVSGLDPNTSDRDSDGVVDALDWSPNNPAFTIDPEYEKIELYLGSTSYQKNAPCPIPDKRGNPISIFTGNKLEIEQDLRFTSPFLSDFIFTRYYNSQSDKTGPLGYGWSHSYLANLTVNYKSDSNLIKIKDESGRGSYFSTQDQINFDGLFMENTTVLFENNEYTWKRHDANLFIFDTAGRLIRIVDAVGNQQIIAYDLNNRLEAVTDQASGRSLSFIYNADGLLDHISGPVTPANPDGVWVSYGYSGGNLTSASYADGSGFVYQFVDTYDAHNLTQKNDLAGSLLSTWSYDDQDRAVTNVTRDGRGVTINYVSESQVDVTDAYGVTRSYTIDESIGDRKRITHAQGTSGCSSCGDEPVRVAYDSSFRILEKEYANGRVNRFEDFDSLDNATTIRLASGTNTERIIHFSYDETNYPWLRLQLTQTEISVLDAGDGSRLKETIWDYDNDYNAIPNENPTPLLSRLIEKGYTHNAAGTVVPYESITVFRYNAKGQLISIDGPLPGSFDTTSFSYDASTGDLLTVIRPLAGNTSFANYTSSGFPQRMTDANENQFSYTYDGRGRIETVTSEAGGGTATFDYNAAGEPDRVTAANGVTTDFEYDAAFGRLTRLLDPLGNYVSYSYDAQGNRIEESIYNPSSQRVFRRRFDFQSPQTPGKLWKEINPDDTYTEYGYDAVGNIQAVTDPTGKLTSYSYDVLKRLIASTQPGAVQTFYEYDRYDNLKSVTDAEGHCTAYDYDDLGRLLETDSPDTGITTYTYDSAGNLVSKTDANAITTAYTYDALNRLTGIVYPDSAQNIAYTYDEGANGKSRLTGMTDPSGVTAYAYDARGNLVSETRTIGGVAYTTSYGYDAAGTLTAMTYPDGRNVAYTFDSAGRVSRVTTTKDGATQVLADNIGYLPFGPVASLTYGNGVSLVQNFDPLYRSSQIAAGSLYNVSYTKDAAGIVTAIADSLNPTRNQTFGYDNLYRLTSATGAYGSISYTYDKIGNRLTETANGQTDTYTYTPSTSRLLQITGANPQGSSLDANGNTTSTGAKTFTYNQNNRLIRAAENSAFLATYAYNGSGQRVLKETDNETVVYHYDRYGNLIAESSVAGVFSREYLYLRTNRMAMVEVGTGAYYYYLNDRLGTPVLMVDATNTAVWEANLSPFGKATVNPNSTKENNFRFAGQYYDNETGLHYNYHRYYDPRLGRYLTPDPIGLAGGLNLYAYVQNNPVNWIDPFGLTKLYFDRKSGYLFVDPERGQGMNGIYIVAATSGRDQYINNPAYEHLKNKGPIPAGNYTANIDNLSNPNFFGDILRRYTGDWGDWRVPLEPCEENRSDRSGFFLHCGDKLGSAGCIDVGGGIFGNENTDRLLKDLLSDPDKIVPVEVW